MNDKLKVLLLCCVSAGARLFFLGSKSLWIDECLAWGASRMGWLEMFQAVATGTPHPPMAFALIKLSTLLAGDGEFGLRLLIALTTASALVPVFNLVKRRAGQQAAFFAGAMWALSPFTVSLGQESWVYGLNAALSLWFADCADRAWRGSSRAWLGALAVGITGILTQHIFVLSIGVGCVLYLSVEPEQRISLKKFLLLPGILALLYLPVFLYFSSQFTARAERQIAAGINAGPGRLFSLQPFSVYFRVLFGGILPEITRNLLERPRMLIAYMLNSATVLILSVVPIFLKRKWKLGGLDYIWVAILLPLLLFFREEPGIRQLSVLWVPLVLTSGALFSRFRWTGPAVTLMCLSALIPYYRLDVFPYHRSNWREAVQTIERMASPEDAVVVFGGKSTSLAWEYYSDTSLEYYAHRGTEAFAGDHMRHDLPPVEYLESILATREDGRVWVLLDVWGIPNISYLAGENTVLNFQSVSEQMEIALVQESR